MKLIVRESLQGFRKSLSIDASIASLVLSKEIVDKVYVYDNVGHEHSEITD